jgi:Lysyl oxidase
VPNDSRPRLYGVVMLRRAVGVSVLLAVLTCVANAGRTTPRVLLPDLDQRPPDKIDVVWGGPDNRGVRLTFASNVENVGFGPLVVVGRRATTRVPVMRAQQFVRLQRGGYERIAGAGWMRFNVNPSHSHWHLQPFEQYELRTLGGRRILRDHKSGFCLTSDHRSPLPTRGPRGTRPIGRNHCAQGEPGATRVVEGIAVGFGDIYPPVKEGQYVDINGVAPGDYVLVHRVNAARRLRESNYANNSSAARIRLLPPASPNDLPGILVLRTCETGTRC